MPSIGDYRRRSARSETELKSLLRPYVREAWHLSPEDSPDLLIETDEGRLIWIEAKAIVKDNFDLQRDDDTKKQHARLKAMAARGRETWYAVKFMGRGWRFYQLPRVEGERSLRLHDTEGSKSLKEFIEHVQDTAVLKP